MTLDDALERARTEREHVAGKAAAFDRFRETVEGLDPSGADAGGAGATTGTPPAFATGGSSPDACRRVRTAFADTVGPHCEGPVLAGVRDELGADLAVALSPETGAGFTPRLAEALRSGTAERQAQLRAKERALEREVESLSSAADELAAVREWLVAADETPLGELGFEALAARHGTLSEHRRRCDRVAADRQGLLAGTTSAGGQIGLTNRSLVEHLYAEFPTDYPVLSAVARTAALCDAARRTVRDHLTRRA